MWLQLKNKQLCFDT